MVILDTTKTRIKQTRLYWTSSVRQAVPPKRSWNSAGLDPSRSSFSQDGPPLSAWGSFVFFARDAQLRVLRAGSRTANLCTKILDFRGFDSSRILISRGGILMSIGDFPEI